MTIVYAALTPVIQFITIAGFIALVTTPVYIFLEKTNMGARFKDKTQWMGWTGTYKSEDDYTNFVIHPSNYIKVPSR
jgi:hypothetical protein